MLLSETGELGPAADEPVDEERLDAFGRAALGAIGAIDAAGPREGEAFAGAPSGIVTLRNVLTDWSVRLVVGSLLLPAILAALDAFFRARRRRVPIGPWLAWLAVAAVPLPIAWAWLRALGATGVIDAPDGPVLPDRFPLETDGIVAMGSALLAGALACAALRFAVGALRSHAAPPAEDGNGARRRPVPGVEGLAVATGVWLCGLSALAWLREPLRRRRAGPGDAPVAVRHGRLACALGGAGDRHRARAGARDRRPLRLRARSRPGRPRLGLGPGGDLRLRRSGRRCSSAGCWPRWRA